ncbi:ECF RNA polymerase sigma factor EcfG [Roseobacter fucihabitans]|uniref:ECF RNA polymerase sigma factor EcfG n=1 Tax=Roseobacter fucihabitans TaxID=1537242 RepID=A0ABZ2BTP8_9RHOB|nr:sigma-70 family RNA polymerase sigma factor [Roseobacter litoralis]MBC6965628.1 ECF RNA polymerase sigma factor SigH [Roseobacter litoralis]
MHDLHRQPDDLNALLPRLATRAKRLSDSQSDADDLAQEAALKLWSALHSGTEVEDLERYAMTVLRNLARQKWRSERPTDPLEEDSMAVLPDAPTRMAFAEIVAAVGRLPENQALLIQMIAAGETSPASLARLTGLPVGTVMSRLARARAKLRKEMGLKQKAPVSELF